MSDTRNTPKPGSVNWRDLTVPDAKSLASFYRDVVGWEIQPTTMGDYDDFCMARPGADDVVAGICHARGDNASLPPQWLIYITVENVDASAKKCAEAGGKILDGPRPLGGGTVCVIQDPAGAVAALYAE